MSARSCCVTCGIVVHAAVRCSAVLRRTARIGWRSISPQRVKSGSGSAGTAPPAAAGRAATIRLACALTSSTEMRPPVPLPATWLMSTPSSRAIRRTDGAAGATGSSGAAGSAAARAPRLMSTTFRPRACGTRLRRPRRLCRPSAALALAPSTCCSSSGASRLGAICRACRLAPAASPARPSARLSRRCGAASPRDRLRRASARGAAAAIGVDGQDRLADLHLVAGLDLDFLDAAGHRRRHFDGGLVGLELEDRLIFRDACRRA